MQKIGKLIDSIPLQMLVIMSIFLGMAPFIPFVSEVQPHLFGKLTMLMNGELAKPIDIFDLFLHGTPVTLLIIRLIRKFGLKTTS